MYIGRSFSMLLTDHFWGVTVIAFCIFILTHKHILLII